MKIFRFTGLLFVAFCFFTTMHIALAAEWTLTGSNSLAGTTGIAMPITDIQVTEGSVPTIPVKLLVTNGTLNLSVTSGLTFTEGGSSGSVLYFTGNLASINSALASLTYTRAGTGTDTLEVSLVNSGEVFFSGTGHLYEYIIDAGDWNSAKTKATAITKYGAKGYLATITSQLENDFVSERLGGAGWMGASDSVTHGNWKWVTGPESGVQFWSGLGDGSRFGGNYANWNSGEPNNSGNNEHCGQFLSGGTGMWNDLPCGGNSLPGYVAEFGIPGTLPTITAKNVSITTGSVPVVSILTPVDNATGVSTTNSIEIKFSNSVSTSTGNIYIKKTSDDSVVETISATSSRISGTGTDTVTIDPVSIFEEKTGYYVTIDSTLFKDSLNNFFEGISSSSTWNFTTGDFTAPELSGIVATALATSSNITWTTNELSSTKVWFGPTKNYNTSTVLMDVSPRVLSHSVSIPNLLACSSYYFVVVSTDGSSNVATSSDQFFTTTGCVASTTPVTATSTAITVSDGGSSTLAQGNSGITITTPSNATATSSSFVIQIQALSGSDVLGSIGVPQSLPNKVGDVVFDVKAIIDSTTILDSFDVPVTISYTYSDSDVEGLIESSLWLYHYHNATWIPLDSCSLDTSSNFITCTTQSFSIFSLFGNVSSKATAAHGSSGGASIKGRVANLTQMGDTRTAEELKSKWPQLFADNSIKTVQISIDKTMIQMQVRDLFLDISGNDVRSLQELLIKNNEGPAAKALSGVGPTKFFGSYTKNALVEYQSTHGIFPRSGYFGSITRTTMSAENLKDLWW